MARILVLDDEPGYLQLISMILCADGHEVETAETGEMAVEIGQRSCPDVLLADWMLKTQLSGSDVARTLNGRNEKLRTIIMTGYSAREMSDDTRDIRDVHILQKPFGAEALRIAVRRAIESGGTSSQ